MPYVEQALHTIIDTLQMNKVNAGFKQFDPSGVTGFILLAESHISIHTWPEHNFAAADIFSCNAFDAEAVKNQLAILFRSDEIIYHTWERGQLPVRELKIQEIKLL